MNSTILFTIHMIVDEILSIAHHWVEIFRVNI